MQPGQEVPGIYATFKVTPPKPKSERQISRQKKQWGSVAFQRVVLQRAGYYCCVDFIEWLHIGVTGGLIGPECGPAVKLQLKKKGRVRYKRSGPTAETRAL